MRRRQFIGVMTVGMLGAWAGVGGTAPPPVGKAAPEFNLTLTDGRHVSLKDFRGKPVLVNFWASG